MLVGVRRKHWVLASMSVTGVLLLLVFSSKPPQALFSTKPQLPNDGGIGFLSRRIANDEGSGADSLMSSTVAALLEPQREVHEPQSWVQLLGPDIRESSPNPQPPPPPPSPSSPPMPKLNKEQRVANAKQGVLIVQYDDEGDLEDPPEYIKVKNKDTSKKDQENWQKEQTEIEKQHLKEEKKIQDQNDWQEEQKEIEKQQLKDEKEQQVDQNLNKKQNDDKRENNNQYKNYSVDDSQINKIIVEPKVQNEKTLQSQPRIEPEQTYQQFKRGKNLIPKSSNYLQIQPQLEQLETDEHSLNQNIPNENLPQYLQLDPHLKQVLTEEQVRQLDMKVKEQLYLHQAQIEAQNPQAQPVLQNVNVYNPQNMFEGQQLHQQMLQHQIMQQQLQQQLERHKHEQQQHYQHQLQQQDNLHMHLRAVDQHLPGSIEGAIPLQQSSSVSVVSRTSQVSEGKGVPASASSAARKHPPHFPHHVLPHLDTSPPEPVNSITELREMSERLLLSSLKREFHGGPWDVRFTPGLPVPKSRVRRVLVLSTWRSGSTFLGDLLKSYPGTFFTFEPLHQLLKNLHLEEGPLVPTVRKLLRGY